jgi:hypothetical protein
VTTTATDRVAMTGKLNWETMPEARRRSSTP